MDKFCLCAAKERKVNGNIDGPHIWKVHDRRGQSQTEHNFQMKWGYRFQGEGMYSAEVWRAIYVWSFSFLRAEIKSLCCFCRPPSLCPQLLPVRQIATWDFRDEIWVQSTMKSELQINGTTRFLRNVVMSWKGGKISIKNYTPKSRKGMKN